MNNITLFYLIRAEFTTALWHLSAIILAVAAMFGTKPAACFMALVLAIISWLAAWNCNRGLNKIVALLEQEEEL